jgi:acyl-CoA thioester hydrolase
MPMSRTLRGLPDKQIEIRWRDLDPWGHVNQAVYLTFVEEVLDDWFRDRLGLRPGTTWDYVIARTTIEYRSELTQADLHAIGSTTLVQLGTTSVTTKVALRAADGRLAAEAETVVVAIDTENRRSRALTDGERAALGATP